jgi:hypothetical protein
MKHLHLSSDHVYDWSDRSIGKILLCVAQAPTGVAAQIATIGCGAAGLADRALQALWQAGLQMCRGAGPRPEVLPVGELPRRATANGLRTTGKSGSHSGARRQLPRGAHDARRGLRNQPRAAPAPRGALRGGGERNVATAYHIDRRNRCCAAPRQHGRDMARRRAAPRHHRGDNR